MEPTEITAGRLHLRPYSAADIEPVRAACQDPAIQRWIPVPVPYEREHAAHFVEQHSEEGWLAGTGHSFAILDSVTAELLGSIGLPRQDPAAQVGEVGYWIAPAARGRGIATQATTAVAGWAFGSLGIARLEWMAEVGNAASRRVAERAGFTIEGTLRARFKRRDGSRADAWIGSLLPGDLR
jgi:RimJ/RimL family protein N-acetyltransferase